MSKVNHLTIITVCRDMADYLAITLPKNVAQCDRIAVASTHDDESVERIVRARRNAGFIPCHELIDRSCFRKSAALNNVLNFLRGGQSEWILLLDVDMILPADFRERLNEMDLDTDSIYGVKRADMTPDQYAHREAQLSPDYAGVIDFAPLQIVQNRKDIGVGAFQLFHSSAACLQGLDKWYPETSNTAARDDRLFVRQWPEDKRDRAGGTAIAKELEGIHPIHIGVLGVNHEGRKSPKIGSPDDVEPFADMPDDEYETQLRANAMSETQSEGVIYLINHSNGFNLRLAMSIWSLRKHYDGPVTIFVDDGGAVNMDDINKIADAFDCDVGTVPTGGKGRKASLPIKTAMYEHTPYDISVFLDADTLVVGDISELLKDAAVCGLAFTDFGWICGGGKMQKRIKPWVDAGLFEMPHREFPAVNTGVFAFHRNSHAMRDWHQKCIKGMETIKDFFGDEVCGNLIASEYNCPILPLEYNLSCLERDAAKVANARVIHFHGRKHFRPNWVKDGDARPPASKVWCEAFEECVKVYPWIVDLCHDKQTEQFLKWRAGKRENDKAMPFPRSRVSPTDNELDFLGRCVRERNPKRILELGCGITTWIIDRNASAETYTIVEGVPNPDDPKHKGFAENIQGVKDHVPHAEWLTNWEYGKRKFDFLFLDSSAGGPPDAPNLNRLGALQAAEAHLQHGAVVCVHDWHGRSGKAVRRYIEASPCYKNITHMKDRTGIGSAVYEPSHQRLDSGEVGTPITDFSDITLTVVANSEHHLQRAEATVSSFRKMKGFNGPVLLVLTSGFLPEVWTNWHDKLWAMETNGRNEREEALGAFVLCSRYVDTKYCLKLDAAMYCIDDQPFIYSKMLDFDMVSMPWGYTKGAQMVPMMDYWIDGHVKAGRLNGRQFQGVQDKYTIHGDGSKPWATKYKAPRVISRLRLAKTSMLREIAELCPHNRLPIPSEDTTLWRFCERMRRPWLTFKFGNCGIAHNKKILKVRDQHPEWF